MASDYHQDASSWVDVQHIHIFCDGNISLSTFLKRKLQLCFPGIRTFLVLTAVKWVNCQIKVLKLNMKYMVVDLPCSKSQTSSKSICTSVSYTLKYVWIPGMLITCVFWIHRSGMGFEAASLTSCMVSEDEGFRPS